MAWVKEQKGSKLKGLEQKGLEQNGLEQNGQYLSWPLPAGTAILAPARSLSGILTGKSKQLTFNPCSCFRARDCPSPLPLFLCM